MSASIYLDHNSTTPLDKNAEKVMTKTFKQFGNPSSPYHIGQEAKELIESSRESISKFIGASPSQLIFTSGAVKVCG